MWTLVEATPTWLSVIAQICIVLGALLFSTAAVGLIRLPDVYTRASAVSTAAGAGVGLIVVGAWLFVPGLVSGVKVLGAVILQLITSTVGTMMLARSAYLTGSAVYSPTHHDELADRAQTDPATWDDDDDDDDDGEGDNDAEAGDENGARA